MKNLRCRRDWIVSENMRYNWIQYIFQWVHDMRASRLWQDQRPKSVTTTCATSATVFAEVRCSQRPDLKRKKRKKHRRLNSTSLCFCLFLFPSRSMPSALSTALSVSYTSKMLDFLSTGITGLKKDKGIRRKISKVITVGRSAASWTADSTASARPNE